MAAAGTTSCEACFAAATGQIRDWVQQTTLNVKFGFSDPEVWASSLVQPVDWTATSHVEDRPTTEAEWKDELNRDPVVSGTNSPLQTPCTAEHGAASPLVTERAVAQETPSCGAASSVCSVIPERGQEAALDLVESMRGSLAGALPHILEPVNRGQEAARALVEHLYGSLAGALPHVRSSAVLAFRATQDSIFQISGEITGRCRSPAHSLQDEQRPHEEVDGDEGPKELRNSQVKAPALWKLQEVREKAMPGDSLPENVKTACAEGQPSGRFRQSHSVDSQLQKQAATTSKAPPPLPSPPFCRAHAAASPEVRPKATAASSVKGSSASPEVRPKATAASSVQGGSASSDRKSVV